MAADRISVSTTAKALGIGWDSVNQAAPDACRQFIYDDPHHLDGVHILSVDKHIRKHTRKPGQLSNLVAILIDLTPLIDGHGSVRLLDLRPGRSAEVLRTWLQERDPSLRSRVQVMAMDGFTGYVSAVNQVLPDATRVMDLFRVVHLAADKLAGYRQRPQREATGQRGRKDDPLYEYRRTLLTRTNYFTQRQKQRLNLLWAIDDDYVVLEMTRLFCQGMIATYGHPKKSEGKELMNWVINNLREGLPASLEELAQLGHTLWR